MRVFWSWQSDINAKISRIFVKKVIERTLAELHEELNLEERPEIDHDTKGELGSPAIVDTIFEKISQSDLFIADVTPIADNGSKKVMNPNVAIEVGYAISELGHRKMMSIMNTSFGDIEDLPFDLRHRRGPILYSLEESATKVDIKKEETALVKKLKPIIRQYVEDYTSGTNEAQTKQVCSDPIS